MEYKIECQTKGAGISITEFVNAKDDKHGMMEAHCVFIKYLGLGLKIFTVCKADGKKWKVIYRKENE